MKNLLVVACLFAVACGGGGSKRVEEPEPTGEIGQDIEPAEEPAPEPEPEPPPPLPKKWTARAELAAVKGAKLRRNAVVVFSQIEGEPAEAVTAVPFEGLKPGTYHLVVHENGDCGKNATKAGKPWADAPALAMSVEKGVAGFVQETSVEVALDGESTIVGRTLVLHDDKKGKPGKALACGPIALDEDEGDDLE